QISRPVQLLETRARVRQPDAGVRIGTPKPGPGITDFDGAGAVLPDGANATGPRPALRVHAVLDGVLDDGLQDHRRDKAVERVIRELRLDAQAIGKPDALNRDVVLEEFHLARERDLSRVLVEPGRQQAAEPADCFRYGRLIAFEGER